PPCLPSPTGSSLAFLVNFLVARSTIRSRARSGLAPLYRKGIKMALSSPRFAGNTRLEKAASNKPAMGWGEKGEPVRVIQQALIDLGYWLDISTKKFGSPDGIFGNETYERVK